MAGYNITKLSAIYTEAPGYDGTVYYTKQGIQYGYFYAANTTQVRWRYSAYITFDISAALRANVLAITLARHRSSLINDYHTFYASYSIRAFISKSTSTPNPLPDVENISFLQGYISQLSDPQTSGVIRTNIDSLLDISKAVSGIVGIALLYNTYSYGAALDNDAWLEIAWEPLPSYAPTGLQPTTTQNPRGNIFIYWNHTPNPYLLAEDPQTASQLEIHQPSTGYTAYPVVGGNNYTVPAHTFWDYGDVYVRARTQTAYNDWGAWSGQIMFTLTKSAPLPPTLLFPLNISINAESGIALEYAYNSHFDTTPTRFDMRYRLNGGAWVTKHNSGQLTIMTDAIYGQNTVEWQVMAYGALGDAGAWSAVGVFYTIGVPADPVILGVSNSNKPAVTFWAQNAISWEMEFLQGSTLVYYTNNNPYTGGVYQAGALFKNGSYTVRLRIANQYGLKSNWVYHNFSINTVPPAALSLAVSKSLDIFARLYFENPNKLTVFVHRGEIDKAGRKPLEYKRIAAVNSNNYKDYTVAPGRDYVYFIRVVNPNFSFADSNTVWYSVMFKQTLIAPVSDMKNVLRLIRQIDAPPEKNRSHSIEKTFTKFVGRKGPVMQIGDHITQSLTYSFYCSETERDILEAYSEKNEALIIRDRRFGTVYGQIDGEITDTPTNVLDGTVVSFAIRQMDYQDEVPL